MSPEILLLLKSLGQPVGIVIIIVLQIYNVFESKLIKEKMGHFITKEKHTKYHKEEHDTLVVHSQQIKVLNHEVFKK